MLNLYDDTDLRLEYNTNKIPLLTEGQDQTEALELLRDLLDDPPGYGMITQVRVGALWERKGYVEAGHLSTRLDNSPYRDKSGADPVVVHVVVAVNRDMLADEHLSLLDAMSTRAEDAIYAARRAELEHAIDQKTAEIEQAKTRLEELQARLGRVEQR